LLINREFYKDDLLEKPRSIKGSRIHSTEVMSLDEMIKTIVRAGYEVRRIGSLEHG